ncbi:hypothetical protein C2G38_2171229 [Gigaspora rosea]|uniref:Transmembrane protein n=1 Tax=Gigaspora rosea TaxID=44941 RepID=A0A397VLV0_9GLOM|nr:hypothetical protein C2G38_2171229 [Gigaspora rosea]
MFVVHRYKIDLCLPLFFPNSRCLGVVVFGVVVFGVAAFDVAFRRSGVVVFGFVVFGFVVFGVTTFGVVALVPPLPLSRSSSEFVVVVVFHWLPTAHLADSADIT